MKRLPIATALSVMALVIASPCVRARNQRIPPPPILISGGGLPDGGGDPWSPDDPTGGGGGGGLDDNGNYGYPDSGPPSGGGGRDTHGDGGWDWWNSAEFWGWGSGWWRYPDPDPTDTGGEMGNDDHDGALSGCRIIVTGGDDNHCVCLVKIVLDPAGNIIWRDTKAYCELHLPGTPECREMNPGDACR